LASKYQLITELYGETLKEISGNPAQWRAFLRSASRNYKCRFDEQVLIFAQRPDATAVLELNRWNQRFGRWVNLGSKGIAVFDPSDRNRQRIKYYFDVSDTSANERSRPVPLWELLPEHEAEVIGALEGTFGELAAKSDVATAILFAASNAVADHATDYFESLQSMLAGSALEMLSEEELSRQYQELLQDSVAYMMLARCGINPANYFDVDGFDIVTSFNTPHTMHALGLAGRDIAELGLRAIAASVQNFEEKELHTFAEGKNLGYDSVKESERSEHDERNIQPTGRLRATQSESAPAGGHTPWEIRPAAQAVSHGEQESVLHEPDDQRQTPPAPDGTRPDSEGAGGTDRDEAGADRGRDRAPESQRPDEVDGSDEQSPAGSGGTGDEQPDLQVTPAERADDEDDSPSAFFMQTGGTEPPGMNEQQVALFGFGAAPENAMPMTEGQVSIFKSFQISQQIIDEALCLGSNEPYSLERICAHFAKDYPLADNAAFLQREYRTDGKGFLSGGNHIAVWFDENGIRIDRGKRANGHRATLLSWTDAAKRVRELLDLGRFVPQEVLEQATSREYTDLAKELWFLVREFSKDAKEQRLMPSVLSCFDTSKVMQEETTQITALLKEPKQLALMISELEVFCGQYAENRNLLGFHHRQPKTILYRLQGLQREQLIFPIPAELTTASKQFISDDEIDRVLVGGSGTSEGKYTICSFFLNHSDRKERISFLKEQYGTSSNSRTGYEESRNNNGISYKRKRPDSVPYAEILLKWPDIEKRIAALIAQGKYLNTEDIAGIPDYEKREVARAVYLFFQDLPIEQPRPFPSGFDYYDAIKLILPQLDNAGQVEEIYRMMLPIWGTTTEDDHLYASRKEGLSYLSDWKSGSFSLFTGLPLPPPVPALPAQEDEAKTAAPLQELPAEKEEQEVPASTLSDEKLISSEQEQPASPIEPQVAAGQELPMPVLPKPKQQRAHFAVLHPEIPAAQRHQYRISDPQLGDGTASQRYTNNIAAIRTLKQIEDEDRLATVEEQEILSRYVGWGGLANRFEDGHQRNAELKSLLTEEEYAAARASTLTAFYTPPLIIEGIYKALEQMGFQEGNILEPACGSGNFLGMLPESVADSKLYGVELDSISGRMAQQLYQNSSIVVNGFEKTTMPDSFFDVAIGNVPFGDFKLSDRRYDKHKWLIHDYFFGATLDKVRPGGIVAFITSKGTLDKENPAVRKYLAQRADLIGAIRLPDNAFQRNAGTEVTSDIIFLQKREGMTDIMPEWVHLDTDENGIKMNAYFVQNPEMILGNMVMETSQFGMASACKPYEGENLSDLLSNAVANLRGQITAYDRDEPEDDEDLSIPADPSVPNFSFAITDGKLYYRENTRMHPYNGSATGENRIRGLIALRDCTRTLIDYQVENYPDAEIAAEQAKLNQLYDAFVKKYGLISSRGNDMAFSDDSSYYLLCSLEILDEHGNLERKADMFTKRTIRSHVPVTHVDTASEALAVSISEKAHVDLAYMEELSGKDRETLIAELEGVIFLNVGNAAEQANAYVTADEYLSGNIRQKLMWARAATEALPSLSVNVQALEAVLPPDLTAAEINVRLGATWVPTETYQQFMLELLEPNAYTRERIKVMYSKYTGGWSVTNKGGDFQNVRVHATYGTRRMSAYHILEQTLNLRDVRVFDIVIDSEGREKPVLNKKETAIAQDKQEVIKARFAAWIWKDIDRREQLCALYNEKFNSIRPREYDGRHINFVGMNPEIALRPHQINAIARIMYGGNTLLAHQVGAGKTYEIVAAAMESKRLGLCTKSMIVVPNHLTEQWAAEWLRLYPSANILVATKKEFQTRRRKKFCSKIATGDYDAVIIGHSQFEKIPMSRERQEIILKRQIKEMLTGIDEARKDNVERFTIKQMERTRKGLENRLEKLNDQSRKDNVIEFEQLGCDRIFVDESHGFKNLFLQTKMRNVAGIAQTEAQKSSDLFMKCQYLDELTDSKGVIFATGTPISNSMVEMYTIQRYLQYNTLIEMDLQHFDAWAANFGETVTAIELSPEGTGYRAKTRFAKFFNLPELMVIFKQVADIQTADMLKLPVPKANYHTVVVKPSGLQKEMVLALAERAEKVRNREVQPHQDNMLLITNDGRKLALDVRLTNPLAPDEEGSKVSVCAENVYTIWRNTAEKRSTQLVFCDLSTPKKAIESVEVDGVFRAAEFQNIYDDLRQKLVRKGIPAEEIAFIHDANTDAQKAELFRKVRTGEVRVLMGSTQKMGAGTNVQAKLAALHDLDCPWRPADLEQRLGRIVRQGNENGEVEIFRYVTEGTFDSYLFQLVESKQKFIGQIMSSKTPVRAAEDIDETALSYAEIKALATGNPHIIEKSQLDMDVSKLNVLKASYINQRYELEALILRTYPAELASYTELLQGYTEDIVVVKANPKPAEYFPPMELLGTVHTEKEAAGKALIAACTLMTSAEEIPLGQYRGFPMTLLFDSINRQYKLILKGSLTHSVVLGADVFGNITRVDNALASLEEKLPTVERSIADLQRQLENAKADLEKPFDKENELAEKTRRLNQLNILLNMSEKDSSVIDTAPEEADPPERNTQERER
jgi:DNA methylase